MASFSTYLLRGALAGAAGTTALNAATYLDMAIRGRPGSTTPEQVVERGAELLNVPLADNEERKQARESGLGALLGAAAGVGTGVVLGLLRGATGHPRGAAETGTAAWLVAMVAGNGPMTVLGITDPRKWGAADWLADVLPHLAYAVTTAATMEAFEARG
jgi:hypothetical protein